MTEEKWYSCLEPYRLLSFRLCRNDRKRRLVSCASARRVLKLIPDPVFAKAVEIAESFADGLATNAELVAARKPVRQAWRLWSKSAPCSAKSSYVNAAMHSIIFVLEKEYISFKLAIENAQDAEKFPTRSRVYCDIIRDIFGNPFRPITLTSSWLTPKVVQLAQEIYDTRAFDRLPALADALEKAGCDNPDILAHCRGSGLHVRGCWVVDLVLGKT